MIKLLVLTVCIRGQGSHEQNATGCIELMSPNDPLWTCKTLYFDASSCDISLLPVLLLF